MSEEMRKKAVELLLAGAALLAEPCPYCKGVRVLKDGNALCISCGREPDKSKAAPKTPKQEKTPVLESMNKKLENLTAELESEKDHKKQQQILKSINALIETMQKLKPDA
jgi:UPF0148 protein